MNSSESAEPDTRVSTITQAPKRTQRSQRIASLGWVAMFPAFLTESLRHGCPNAIVSSHQRAETTALRFSWYSASVISPSFRKASSSLSFLPTALSKEEAGPFGV